MSDQRYPNPYVDQAPPPGPLAPTAATEVRPDARTQQAFLTHAFVWMFVGLAVTAGVAYFVQSNERLLEFTSNNVFLLLIAQFALAMGISIGIRRISATAALGLFFVYAASLGLTIGLIVSYYTTGSVATAFLSSSAMFGAAAIYGHVTKRSLAGLGALLFMGVIGLFVASIINIFLVNNTISWVISVIGVVIFTGLTAWDVQRIQNGQLAVYTGSIEKAAVLGALHLYLDFVNLFLFLLRIFGARN
jgi:FtsH-binding integral membrane protein